MHPGSDICEPRHGGEVIVVGVFAAGLGEIPSTAGAIPPARPFDGLHATLHETSFALRLHIRTQRFAVTTQRTVKAGDHELL
jgi:hypothetical protein